MEEGVEMSDTDVRLTAALRDMDGCIGHGISSSDARRIWDAIARLARDLARSQDQERYWAAKCAAAENQVARLKREAARDEERAEEMQGMLADARAERDDAEACRDEAVRHRLAAESINEDDEAKLRAERDAALARVAELERERDAAREDARHLDGEVAYLKQGAAQTIHQLAGVCMVPGCGPATEDE